MSDELLGTLVPISVYWIYSGIYVLLGSFCEKYRLHSKRDEDEKNLVSKGDVIRGVLLQQTVQAVVSMVLFAVRFPELETESSCFCDFVLFLFDCFFSGIIDTYSTMLLIPSAMVYEYGLII